MRYLAAAALSLCLATPLAATDLASMTDSERQVFRDEVRAYLLENPEVLLEAISILEDRQAAQQGSSDAELIEYNAAALFDDGYSYVGGNPDGDVVMVEFLDYKCGFCKKAFPEVTELVRTDGNIRFIIKEFPILGEQSTMASRFAISVLHNAGPETYEKVHDELMSFRGTISEKTLRRLAKSMDLDVGVIMDGMDNPKVDAEIAENRALAQRMKITGTPGFVVGDQMMRGYVPLKGMQKIVASLRD